MGGLLVEWFVGWVVCWVGGLMGGWFVGKIKLGVDYGWWVWEELKACE